VRGEDLEVSKAGGTQTLNGRFIDQSGRKRQRVDILGEGRFISWQPLVRTLIQCLDQLEPSVNRIQLGSRQRRAMRRCVQERSQIADQQPVPRREPRRNVPSPRPNSTRVSGGVAITRSRWLSPSRFATATEVGDPGTTIGS